MHPLQIDRMKTTGPAKKITANFIDIEGRNIYLAQMTLAESMIIEMIHLGKEDPTFPYISPGFVDAHVHIESSMLTPTRFGEQALAWGTVATVSDPHEIANVLGMEGVRFMAENAALTPLKIMFGAPSCVPATLFETAGAALDAEDLKILFDEGIVGYLAEVMNYPGVLGGDKDMMAKIKLANDLNKPIDGHAPGMRGEDIPNYFGKGITTDHECYKYAEALEKAQYGVNIIIREGSAAKNYEELKSLIASHPAQVMFCSDDKHPDDLIQGHINQMVQRALHDGFDFFDVMQIACVNPVRHYHMPVGLCRVGDPADFIVIDNPKTMRVLQTWINGQCVWPNPKKPTDAAPTVKAVNRFDRLPISADLLKLDIKSSSVRCIEVLDGELITLKKIVTCQAGFDGYDLEQDVLKMAVLSRYDQSSPALACIHGFGLKSGAIASSIAHDSHNIIAVGTNDQDLHEAISLIIQNKGGICAVANGESGVLPLEIAGLMSHRPCHEVAYAYQQLTHMTRKMGSTLKAPFMSLSFMALLVIPSLKLSDKGLFDGSTFTFTGSEVW
jgi:adenine deaminase